MPEAGRSYLAVELQLSQLTPAEQTLCQITKRMDSDEGDSQGAGVGEAPGPSIRFAVCLFSANLYLPDTSHLF